MQRCVEPELLDELPPLDQRAVNSRRDLERLNWLMGNARVMARILLKEFKEKAPRQIIDLGAGDGRFMLKVARQLSHRWPGVTLLLLDRQYSVQSRTLSAFRELGWKATPMRTDILDGLNNRLDLRGDAVVANLFLHHFSEPHLAALFNWVRRSTDLFLAIEPTRSRFALTFSQMVGVIGCRAVTRHDAPVSVRAGFAQNDLSRLWQADRDWTIGERSVGWFGHVFVAKRANHVNGL